MSNSIVMFMHKDDPVTQLEINSEGVIVNTYTDASEKFKMKEISLLESSGKNLAV